MVADKDKRCVTELESERRKIATQLEAGGISGRVAARLLDRHETIDWLIAKTPARDLKELEVKFGRLLEATAFDERDATASLEAAIMTGLRQDLARMAGRKAHPITAV